MLVFIITLAIISLCLYVFQLIWKQVLKWCYDLLLKSVDVVAKVITSVKRNGKAIMYLYRRFINGKTVRNQVDTEGEDVDIDMLPEELQQMLNTGKEVINHEGDIDPAEF